MGQIRKMSVYYVTRGSEVIALSLVNTTVVCGLKSMFDFSTNQCQLDSISFSVNIEDTTILKGYS